MLSSIRRFHVTAPLVVAVLALVVALGGTGYAAAKINGSAIAQGTLPGKALKPDTVTGDKVAENTLGKVPAAAVADSAATAGSAAPSGPAGGSLTGSYPNPQLANGAVTATKMGTIVERNATSSNIPAGSSGDATANCLPGERLVFGGSDGYYDVYVVAMARSGPNGWRVSVKNVSNGNRTVTAHAYCLQ